MKGALQVAVMMLSALRIQKWLLCVGALIMTTGYLLPVWDLRAVVVVGFIVALLPSLFMSGILLRYFAAQPSLRLVPRGREQLLGGTVLAVVAVATASVLVGWSLGAPPIALPVIGLWVVATLSLLVLSQFLLLGSATGMVIWMVLLMGVANLQVSSTTRGLLRSVGQNPEWLAAFVVLAWVGFAIGFLRARSFKAPSSGTVSPGKRMLHVSATQETARRAFLFGSPSLRQQLTSSGMPLGLASVFGGLLFVFVESRNGLEESAIRAIGVALGIGVFAGIGGWIVAQRSKSLWLHGGLDRMGLFRLCESQAWKFFRIMAMPALGLLAIAWMIRPSAGISYTIQAVFHFCGGACFLYFGLRRVRGWRTLDLFVGILLGGVWLAMFVATQAVPGKPWLVPALIAVTLTIAFALRLSAMHRWRNIDWLVCKPPRQPARDETSLAPQ
jgi:hypothetical protein